MKYYFSHIVMVGLLVLGFPLFAFAQENAGQKMEGFNLEGFGENGQKAWDVKGTTADILGQKIEISDVDANHYGEKKVNLKAQKGTVDKASGDVVLEKDVVITADDGSQLKTDFLNWEKEKNTVSTDALVTLSDDKMTATGTGLKAQSEMKSAQLEKDVTVKVNVGQDEKAAQVVTITCDGPMEIDQRLNMATFNNNVVAEQEGRILKADRAEIYFDPDKKRIRQLVCIGHVVIQQGENVSYAERAVYNASDQKITLSGQPKLILFVEGEGGLAGLNSKP